ncbi:hypothetical protein I79_014787 [Cricetulus griseus]|uniref:Uncharacterized protein n=1 Tax=Cricetulus griseus TaxID=10029 RepID=G3HV14_CRIGR|nr:hypothetical protein I79_014787 [Cricetulus griseus]
MSSCPPLPTRLCFLLSMPGLAPHIHSLSVERLPSHPTTPALLSPSSQDASPHESDSDGCI